MEWAGLAVGECVAQSAINGRWSWLKKGCNAMTAGTLGMPRGFQGSVSAKSSQDYADHKVIYKSHSATGHFSKRLLPRSHFINISFGYRLNESMFHTNSLLKMVRGAGAYNKEVVGD